MQIRCFAHKLTVILNMYTFNKCKFTFFFSKNFIILLRNIPFHHKIVLEIIPIMLSATSAQRWPWRLEALHCITWASSLVKFMNRSWPKLSNLRLSTFTSRKEIDKNIINNLLKRFPPPSLARLKFHFINLFQYYSWKTDE